MAIHRSPYIRSDSKRLGVVKIARELLSHEPAIREVFKVFYPLKVSWEDRVIIYEGHSELFRELKEGELTPQYEIHFEKIAEGSYKIEAHELATESNTP